MAKIVTDQIRGNTPILMCSVPGYDASGRVDDLAAELGTNVSSVAIGSEEGFRSVVTNSIFISCFLLVKYH